MPKSDLLARILDTPHLAHIVPRLQPEVLHRVIQHCGLEDCGELVALATPEQLTRVFDLDLWRSSRPGLDERLDADRFGVWLEVLLECGDAVAVDKLMGIDPQLVIGALAQHVRVFDRAAVSRSGCEIGNYLIEPSNTGAWDAIVQLLLLLHAEHHDYFTRLMQGCRRLSNAGFEIDGLHNLLTDGEQNLFDLAVERHHRREKQGYIPPADARAFFELARRAPSRHSAPNPIASAYFRSIDAPIPPDEALAPPDAAAATMSIMNVLADAGVISQGPRAMLTAGDAGGPRLARMRVRVQSAEDVEQLAFLANAMIAGCSIQGRPFTHAEASEAAAAVCNLGLENRPDAADALIDVFRIGWEVLHREVCMYTAERLIAVLRDLQCADREVQSGLDALRVELSNGWRDGTPWHARDAMDVLVALDMPAWAALLGLVAECPVMHVAIAASRGAKIRTIDPSAFEFISENSQIAAIRTYLDALPEALRD